MSSLDLPFDAVVMNAAVGTTDGIKHAVDDTHPDPVPGDAHGCARMPAVVHGVVAVQSVGIHVAVGRVVPPADSVEKPADHTRGQTAAGHLEVRQPQPGSRAGVVRLQVAERLTEVPPRRVDELRYLRRSAGVYFGGFVEGELLENLSQVVFALWVPVQGLELGLQEVGGQGMAAHSLE